MSRNVLVSVLAWGDNVVSMRLLRDLRGSGELRILGTDLTRELASALEFSAFPITVIGHVTSAVYDVAEAGLWRAFRDFRSLGRAIREQARGDALVLFESQRRRGTHRLLQRLGSRFRYAQPEFRRSVYEDRAQLFEQAFGTKIALPPAVTAPRRPRSIVIAPASRMGFKMFPHPVVESLIAYAKERGAEVYLLDAYEDFREFRDQVTAYVARQAVAMSIDVVRQADVSIVADSLFLHVAYYLGRPALALVPDQTARFFYFAPPGVVERDLYLAFSRASDRATLFAYLDQQLST